MRTFSPRVLRFVGLFGLLAPGLGWAQSVLVVEHAGKGQMVRDASDSRAMIEIDGKLVTADGDRFKLVTKGEYTPLFVSVRKVEVGSRAIDLIGTGAELNHEFTFRADFASPFHLKRVFLVLELESKETGKMLFLREIGELSPRKVTAVNVAVPMNGSLGAGRYHLHVFTDGKEVLHSLIPFPAVESALDQMIARRVQGAKDGEPTLFVGPAPEYPPALLKSRANGEAIISVRIAANGRVLDPAIARASDPAFGNAALEAIRQWRFMPKIENGRPQETKAMMPFIFAPPGPG